MELSLEVTPELAAALRESKGSASAVPAGSGTPLTKLTPRWKTSATRSQGALSSPPRQPVEPLQPAPLTPPAPAPQVESWEELAESDIVDVPLPTPPPAVLDALAGDGACVPRTLPQPQPSFNPSPSAADTGGESEEAPAAAPGPSEEPVVVVDLQGLCGFAVRPVDRPAVVAQLETDLYPNFDTRVDELFDVGMAWHGTSQRRPVFMDDPAIPTAGGADAAAPAARSQEEQLLTMRYPEASRAQARRMWKELCQPSRFACCEAIKERVRQCGRLLAWKLQAASELEALAERVRHRQKLFQLRHWKRYRAQRIEQLDQVREVFLEQVDRERDKLDDLLRDGEEADGFGGFAPPPPTPAADERSAADATAAERKKADAVKQRAIVKQLLGKLDQIDELYGRLLDEEEDDEAIEADKEEARAAKDWADFKLAMAAPPREVSPEPTPDEPQPPPTPAAAPAAAYAEHEDERPEAAAAAAPVTATAAAHGRADGATLLAKEPRCEKGGRGEGTEGVTGEGSASSEDAAGALVAEEDDPLDALHELEDPSELRLVDGFLAMILGRLPRRPGTTDDDHFRRLAHVHGHLRHEWLREFKMPNLEAPVDPLAIEDETSEDGA